MFIEVSFLTPILKVVHSWIMYGTNDFWNNSVLTYKTIISMFYSFSQFNKIEEERKKNSTAKQSYLFLNSFKSLLKYIVKKLNQIT